jgi:tryptophanyl-tRNA synthetase
MVTISNQAISQLKIALEDAKNGKKGVIHTKLLTSKSLKNFLENHSTEYNEGKFIIEMRHNIFYIIPNLTKDN